MADRMTPHQRAAYSRARIVPDDTFLQEPDLQGPMPMPRNYLADLAREYGMHGLSNNLNQPNSLLGLAADVAIPLGNALVVEPAKDFVGMFDRFMTEGYRLNDPRNAEQGFSSAGAAMVGGLAAPRPKGSIGMSGRPEGAALNAAGERTNALAERPGIRAYHGSPHDFDKFDMSQIGTGEGAQAYGHGLYFAEREGVAKSYRDALGGQKLKDGTSFDERNPAHWAAEYVSRADGDTSKALDLLRADMTPDMKTYEGAQYQRLLRARGMIEKGETIPEIGRGKMYEVRINASPDDFLDWDKPLSQQSEKVRALFPNAAPDTPGAELMRMAQGLEAQSRPPQSGDAMRDRLSSMWHNMNASVGTTKGASEAALKDAGISGIRYLDKGSRTAGEGSRNYVVFDDNLVEILRKYGLLGMIGGGAAAAGSQSDAKKPTDWARKMQPGDA